MRNEEHSTDCRLAVERHPSYCSLPEIRGSLGNIITTDPDAVRAWLTCPDVAHDTFRLAFRMCANVMYEARALLAASGV